MDINTPVDTEMGSAWVAGAFTWGNYCLWYRRSTQTTHLVYLSLPLRNTYLEHPCKVSHG